MTKQDLDSFIFDCIQRLERFEKMWREAHEIDPEITPLELEPGDWDDQFKLFSDFGDKADD
jgi:hypothetical protein